MDAEEEMESYSITEKGIAVALQAEKLIMEGMSLEDAAKHIGLDDPLPLRYLLAMMPNITVQDIQE